MKVYNKKDILGLIGLFMFFTLSHIVNFFSYIGFNIQILTDYNIIAFVKVSIYFIILLFYLKQIDNMLLLGIIVFIFSLLLSVLINYNNATYINEIINGFIFDVFPLILIILFIRDTKKILSFMRIISYPIIVLVLFIPFTEGYMVQINYMTLAYSSIINWAVVAYYAFKNKNLIDIILTILLIINYVLFGNRGSIIIIALFLLWCLFNFSRNKALFTISIIAAFTIFLINYERLLNSAFNFLEFLGISSRTLNAIVNGQLTESSAREIIWTQTVNAIRDNPFGYGIGYDRVINNGIYAHNMILELFTSFGVVIGSFIIVFIIIMCLYMFIKCKDEDTKALFSIFSIVGLLILQLSYSIFSVYYLYVSLTLFYLYILTKKEKDIV